MTTAELVQVSEKGDGQDRLCPICGADPGHPCSEEEPPGSGLGIEYMDRVHQDKLEQHDR